MYKTDNKKCEKGSVSLLTEEPNQMCSSIKNMHGALAIHTLHYTALPKMHPAMIDVLHLVFCALSLKSVATT